MTKREAYDAVRAQLPLAVSHKVVLWILSETVHVGLSGAPIFERYKFHIPFYGVRKKGTIKLPPELVAELCLLA